MDTLAEVVGWSVLNCGPFTGRFGYRESVRAILTGLKSMLQAKLDKSRAFTLRFSVRVGPTKLSSLRAV